MSKETKGTTWISTNVLSWRNQGEYDKRRWLYTYDAPLNLSFSSSILPAKFTIPGDPDDREER